MPPAPTRGRTTQNSVSSRSNGSANFSTLASMTTPSKSSEKRTASTRPISTSLVRSLVFSASIPAAVEKRISMVGPWV